MDTSDSSNWQGDEHDGLRIKKYKPKLRTKLYGAVSLADANLETRTGTVASVFRTQTFVLEGDALQTCSRINELPNLPASKVVVGDSVEFQCSGDFCQITKCLARSSALMRQRKDTSRMSGEESELHVVAANIDCAVIVAAARDPEFHPRFIDRYLIICEKNNIAPIICITKTDLVSVSHEAIAIYRNLGIPIVETSTVWNQGLEALKDLIRAKTVVLVGNSGVGKSTLVNIFSTAAAARTAATSKKSRQGRHTTTGSSLYKWDSDSYVIDTPGIRLLGVDHINKTLLKSFFIEFAAPSRECEFTNCLHDKEQLCGVKTAIDEGAISLARYESYLAMLRE